MIARLKFAQSRRIRRADVERNVIGKLAELTETMEIILRRFFQRRRFRFADVDPDPAVLRPASASAQFSQARRNCIRAVVIEAEAVDERLLLRETEDAWSRISGLPLAGLTLEFA